MKPILNMSRYIRALVLCLPFLALASCSVNPATGKQSFTAFMSPAEEMEAGRREHPKILKQFGGAYKNRELTNYVRRIGLSLARTSEMPNLSFTFTVLNEDKVNAFALPGGYVYITRGLLALADNEAEMAGVLAHEIGHVTARHTAERYSKTVAASIGLTLLGVLGSAAGGVPAGTMDMASFGTQAFLQSFSREQELEADMLGVRYLDRAGYSPDAMSGFLRKLEANDKLDAALAGGSRKGDQFNIMASHPRTVERIAKAIRLARIAPKGTSRLERQAYLDQIDGMIFGDDPAQGIRRGRDFLHPELGFRFTVPPNFVMYNSPSQLVARGPGGSIIAFDMENSKKARMVRDLRSYLVDGWGGRLNLSDVERIQVNAMEAITGKGLARLRGGETRDARLLAIRERRDRIYRFIFLTPPSLTNRLSTGFQRTTYSFRRLSEAEAANARPLRLKVITVEPGDTVASLAARMPFEKMRLEWFEVLNGLGRGQPLIPGTKVKIVTE